MVIKNNKLHKWGGLGLTLALSLLLSSLLWSTTAQAAPDAPSNDLSIHNDALNAPDANLALDAQNPAILSAPLGAGLGVPGYYQTSDYMIGHVAVGLILPESNGSHETDSEQWTSAELEQVQEQVQQALEWWASLEPAAHLEFTLETHLGVPIGYEPIAHTLSDEELWIGETMAALGFENDNHFGAVRDYVNDLRERSGSDWALAILVVDSSADSDGRFEDNYFAYAYIGGPFMVMTYDNSGYGSNNMNAVTTHEMGHIFHALDQYASSGMHCDYRAGYLYIKNANSQAGGDCDSNESSIMRGGIAPYQNRSIDASARGQIGWEDSNDNGVLDPVDAPPQFIVEREQASDNQFSFSGFAWQEPVPAPQMSDVTISHVTAVGALVDNMTWSPATSLRGSFEAITASFHLDVGPLAPGLHILEIQAVNSEDLVSTPVLTTVLVLDPVDGALDSLLISNAAVVAGNKPIQFQGTASAAYGDTQANAPTVSAVQFSVDGGEWQDAIASDGQFDNSLEDFNVTLTDLPDGQHSLSLRTVDSNGKVETNVETHQFQVETTFTVYLPTIQS
jgi:hypothetical protein